MDDYKFVSIEGPDAAGKTTIVESMDEIDDVVSYKTPPGPMRDFTGYYDKEASVESRFLFYLSGLVDSSYEVEELLEDNNVVADRWRLSTLLYHQAMIEDSERDTRLEDSEKLEEEISSWDIIKPDKTFVLLADEDTLKDRIRRKHKKSKSVTDKEIEEDDFFRNEIIDKYYGYDTDEYEIERLDTSDVGVEETVEEIRKDMGI